MGLGRADLVGSRRIARSFRLGAIAKESGLSQFLFGLLGFGSVDLLLEFEHIAESTFGFLKQSLA